jgi:glutathione S-transferase
MARPHLVIGNKTYSSWSLRPWIAMRQAGIVFTEEVIALDRKDTRTKILAHSAAGRVPVLHHGKITVWESLAIMEYVAETFPEAGLWPKAKAARALARAVASEMHGGFAALRSACPMNMKRKPSRLAVDAAVRRDARRIEELWASCRVAHGGAGPFLFGRFSAADAMYAPVVNRLHVYGFRVSPETRSYMVAMMGLPAWQDWDRAARAEPWVIAHEDF